MINAHLNNVEGGAKDWEKRMRKATDLMRCISDSAILAHRCGGIATAHP